MRVYIAAPKAQVERARCIAFALHLRGLEVVSCWHTLVSPGDQDPTDYIDALAILEQNLADLRRADVVLALTREGEGRGVYTEIGRALERGIPVVWSLEKDGRAIDWADPGVFLAFTDEAAIETLCDLARERARGVAS